MKREQKEGNDKEQHEYTEERKQEGRLMRDPGARSPDTVFFSHHSES